MELIIFWYTMSMETDEGGLKLLTSTGKVGYCILNTGYIDAHTIAEATGLSINQVEAEVQRLRLIVGPERIIGNVTIGYAINKEV